MVDIYREMFPLFQETVNNTQFLLLWMRCCLAFLLLNCKLIGWVGGLAGANQLQSNPWCPPESTDRKAEPSYFFYQLSCKMVGEARGCQKREEWGKEGWNGLGEVQRGKVGRLGLERGWDQCRHQYPNPFLGPICGTGQCKLSPKECPNFSKLANKLIILYNMLLIV